MQISEQFQANSSKNFSANSKNFTDTFPKIFWKFPKVSKDPILKNAQINFQNSPWRWQKVQSSFPKSCNKALQKCKSRTKISVFTQNIQTSNDAYISSKSLTLKDILYNYLKIQKWLLCCRKAKMSSYVHAGFERLIQNSCYDEAQNINQWLGNKIYY